MPARHPPWFRRRQQWYGLHLIKSEHTAKQMAYDTQLDWINKMFIGANVTSLKKRTRVDRKGPNMRS